MATSATGKTYQHKHADFYTCSTNSLSKGVFDEKCSQHYIRTEVVRKLVLSAIQGVCGYVRENEAEFVAKIREESTIQQLEAAKDSKRRLAQNQKRIAELDRLFKKTYEDNASGKLSDKRFEQLTAQIAAFNEDSEKSSRFIELVRRYTEYDELTTPILNSFVNKIVVHEADKSSGQRVQDVDIYFNFIGRFPPPTAKEIETAERERLAAEEIAEAERRERRRESSRKWAQRNREKERAEKAATETPLSDEEREAAKQAKQAAQIERNREYQRNWARQKSAKRKVAQAVMA